MEKDLISVLIPAYNVEKYIVRCLNSVLKQTYQNLEVVVVDDGSTDKTYELAKKIADTDARVTLLQKPNEENVAKTRNFLLEHCHGQYCVWVDSDDRVKPDYVAKLYTALTTHQADLSVCRFAVRAFPFPIWSPWHSVAQPIVGEQMVPQIVFKKGFTLWNKMYRMEIVNGAEPVRFEPDCCYGEDLLFNLYYLRHCQKIVALNDRLYGYSWRRGSEVHKKFTEKQINFIYKMLNLCQVEENPIVKDTILGWVAISSCGTVLLANQHRYRKSIEPLKGLAYQYRGNFYKNRLAKKSLKCILWLGLKTWCRPKKTREPK